MSPLEKNEHCTRPGREATIPKPNIGQPPLFGQSHNVTVQIWSSLKLRVAFDGWHQWHNWAARQQLVIRHENQGD